MSPSVLSVSSSRCCASGDVGPWSPDRADVEGVAERGGPSPSSATDIRRSRRDPRLLAQSPGYLQSRLWDRAGPLPTRSLLVHLLVSAERDHAASTDEVPWPQFYAGVILLTKVFNTFRLT